MKERSLTDAVDLLLMLEHLMDGLARNRESHIEIPWEGMQLTLAQSREIIQDANRKMIEDVYKKQNFMSSAPKPIKEKEKTAIFPEKSMSLSSRIQRLPTE